MGTTITSRDFNRDVSAAKRAAEQGPVTITDHGRPSHVLLTATEFDRLSGSQELMGTVSGGARIRASTCPSFENQGSGPLHIAVNQVRRHPAHSRRQRSI
ncbi:MAG: type II toxin-antitoxin system prevent-host-death family antitoxin [Micropruina sp.]|uniref:type II toxin-antitoxin system prevent-host-death family antitoxin n=1 Tax=Micropruina sp. TaxID=2737536 RepID=UPI0039E602BA